METNRRSFFGMLFSAPLALIPGTTVKFEKRLKRPAKNVFMEREGTLRRHRRQTHDALSVALKERTWDSA